MSDIEHLRDLINPKAILHKQDDYSNSFNIVLEESHECNSKIKILGVPENSIVFRLDELFSEPLIFQGNHGERKRADFIIISYNQGQKYIVIIEMKVANSSYAHEIKNQLRGGISFLFYCQAVLRYFWNYSGFNPDDYEIHYVACKTGIKKIHKKGNSFPNTTVESFLQIWGQSNVHFNHLLGR